MDWNGWNGMHRWNQQSVHKPIGWLVATIPYCAAPYCTVYAWCVTDRQYSQITRRRSASNMMLITSCVMCDPVRNQFSMCVYVRAYLRYSTVLESGVRSSTRPFTTRVRCTSKFAHTETDERHGQCMNKNSLLN